MKKEKQEKLERKHSFTLHNFQKTIKLTWLYECEYKTHIHFETSLF